MPLNHLHSFGSFGNLLRALKEDQEEDQSESQQQQQQQQQQQRSPKRSPRSGGRRPNKPHQPALIEDGPVSCADTGTDADVGSQKPWLAPSNRTRLVSPSCR